jgi:hypothetical protein
MTGSRNPERYSPSATVRALMYMKINAPMNNVVSISARGSGTVKPENVRIRGNHGGPRGEQLRAKRDQAHREEESRGHDGHHRYLHDLRHRQHDNHIETLTQRQGVDLRRVGHLLERCAA